jgi:hypothetical protein
MIQFICGSLACAQMYLGVGSVVVQSSDLMIYSTFSKEYVCQVSGNIYTCQGRDIQ